MATTSDIQNFFAKQKAQPAANPALPPIPATKGTSTADFQKFFTAKQPAGKPLAQRGFEALPGGKFAEQFAGEQKNYWGGQIEHLKKQVEPLIGKPEHRGALQKSWQEFVNTPSVKQAWERINTPLNQNPEEYKRLQAKREWEDHQFAQKHGGVLQAGRGVMESIYDTAAGFTSPVQALLTVGLEGQGAEAKAALKEAGDFAEADGGLKAIQNGTAKTDQEALAAAKRARQAGEAIFNENQILATPLKEFTAKKALSSLMSLGFSAQMLSQVKPAFEQAEAQFKAGDITGGIRSGTDALFGVVFGLGGAAHAVGEGFEARGQWKNEAEVKTALQAGAQENYNKPWEKLTPNEKAKVVYEAVNKYGPEESKKFHRTIREMEDAPPVNANLDRSINQAVADREALDRGNEAIFAAIAKPAPELTPEDRAWEESQAKHDAWTAERAAAEARRAAGQPLSEFEFAQMQAKQEPPRRMKPVGYEARKSQTAVNLKPPPVRPLGSGIVEVREQKEQDRIEGIRKQLTEFPMPKGGPRTGITPAGALLNFPQKAPKVVSAADDALRTLEDERAQQAKAEEQERAEEAAYRAGGPLIADRRSADLAKVEALIREEMEQVPEHQSQLERMYTGLTDALVNQAEGLIPRATETNPLPMNDRRTVLPEVTHARLMQKARFGTQPLTPTEQEFMSMYARRKDAARFILDPVARKEGARLADQIDLEWGRRIRILSDQQSALWKAGWALWSEAQHQPSVDLVDTYAENAVKAAAMANAKEAKLRAAVAERKADLAGKSFSARGTEKPFVKGKATAIDVPEKSYSAQYGAMRKSDLILSHDPFSFTWNSQFEPHELQPRNLETNLNAQARIIADSTAETYKLSHYANTAAGAVEGPAAVLRDGRVGGGNSRLARLFRALQTDAGPKIIRDMYAAMPQFDIKVTEDMITSLDNDDPYIIVRILDAWPESTAELSLLGDALNQSPALGFSEAEEAVKAGQRLQVGDVQQIVQWIDDLPVADEDKSLAKVLAAKSKEVYDLMARVGAIAPNERERYITGTVLTDRARELFTNMVMGRVISDARLMAQTSDSIKAKLERALVPLVKLADVDPESDWYITDYLKDALDLWLEIPPRKLEIDRIGKKSDSVIDRHLHREDYRDKDSGMFAPARLPGTELKERHPASIALAMLLEKVPLQVKNALLNYVDEMEGRQGSLIGGPSAEEAFNSKIGSLVGVKVPRNQWGTPVDAPEREALETPKPTPEQMWKAEHPREEDPVAAVHREAAKIMSAAENGTVTPVLLKGLFEADPKFREWADPLMKIWGRIMPKMAGMSLADLLKKALADWINLHPGEKKGEIRMAADGRRIIETFEHADAITAAHEVIHLARPYMRDRDQNVLRGLIHEFLRKHGYSEERIAALKIDGKWNRDEEEVLARWWEQFLTSGKSPVDEPEFRNIFERLRDAFRDLYLAVKSWSVKLENGKEVTVKIPAKANAVFESWFGGESKREGLKPPPGTKKVRDLSEYPLTADELDAPVLAAVAKNKVQSVEGTARIKRFGTYEEAESWAYLNKNNFKAAEIWKSTQGPTAGMAYALHVPVDPDTLYQEAASILELSMQLRSYREALQKTPEREKWIKPEIDRLQKEIDKRLSAPAGSILDFSAPPKSGSIMKKPPGSPRKPAEPTWLFGEEAADGGEAKPAHSVPDDQAGVRDPGRNDPVAERAGRPGDGETRSKVSGNPPAGRRGSREPVRVELATKPSLPGSIPPWRAAPTRPYDPLRQPTMAPDKWRERLAALLMPWNAPVPRFQVDDDIAAVLRMAGQREIGNYIISAYEQWNGAVIASTTGTGKTFTSLAIAEQMRRRGAKRQIIVTRNWDTINDNDGGFKAVGRKHYGMKIQELPHDEKEVKPEGIYITTYATLLSNPWASHLKWDFATFDESADARNWDAAEVSQRALVAKAVSDASDKALYVSATPFASAVDIGYMTKLGLWEPGRFDDWAKQYGAKRDSKGNWAVRGTNPKDMIKLREQLIESGQFISQDKSYDGHSMHFAMVPLSPEQKAGMADIRAAFNEAASYYTLQGEFGKAKSVRGAGAVFMKSYLERIRLKPMIEMMKQAQQMGWDLAVMAENHNELTKVTPLLRKYDDENGNSFSKRLPKFDGVHKGVFLPSIYKELAAAFGEDQVANYSGKSGGGRTRELEAFMSGKKRVIFSSYGAGGVGVNMHDRIGTRPRMVFYVGPSYNGFMVEQALGRFWRFGTKSNVVSVFMGSDAVPEVRMTLTKIVPRLESLKAAIHGVHLTDPLIQRMKNLDKEHTSAAEFELGGGATPDMDDFHAVQDKIPIGGIEDVKRSMRPAAEAKNKGLRSAGMEEDKPGVYKTLFQADGSINVPPRFLSSEEAKAQLLNEELMQSLVDGDSVPVAGDQLADLPTGQRKILADGIGPTIRIQSEDWSEADAVGTTRVAAKTAFTKVLAAKYAGEIDALEAGGEGGKVPGWEMRAPGKTEPADPLAGNERFRVHDFLLSGQQNILSITKQLGRPEIGQHIVDSMIRKYMVNRADYAGTRMSEFQKMLRDNKITKKDFRVLWMVKEGKIPAPDARFTRAVQQWTQQMNEIRAEAEKRNIFIEDFDENGEKKLIPYSDVAEKPNYLPHIHDHNEKVRIPDPVTGEEHVFTLNDLIGSKLSEIKKDRIYQSIQAQTGKSRWEIQKFLSNRPRRTPLSGNLERARGADLPFYRMDQGAMMKYYEDMGELFARAEIFGQERGKLDAVIARLPNDKARKEIDSIMDQLLKPQPWDQSTGKFYSRLMAAQVITKMVFSPVKVPFHLVHMGLVLEDFRPVLSAIVKTATGYKELRDNAMFAAAVADQTKAEAVLDYGTDLKLANRWLDFTGFNWLYKVDRIIGSTAGQQQMEKYMLPALVRKAKNSAHIREQLRNVYLIDDADIDKAITAGRWTETDLKRGGAAAANMAMFTSDPTEMAPAMRGRGLPGVSDRMMIRLRVAAAMKTFTFKTAMLLKRRMVDEARKGNIRPLVQFILAYPLAGAAMTATGALLQAGAQRTAEVATGRDRGQNAWDRYEAGIEDLFDDPSAAKIFKFWLDDTAHASAMTIASHLYDVLLSPSADKRKARFQLGQLPEDELEQMIGPAYTDIAQAFIAVKDMIGALTIEDGDKRWEKFKKAGKTWMREESPLLRAIVPANPATQYEMAPPPQ